MEYVIVPSASKKPENQPLSLVILLGYIIGIFNSKHIDSNCFSLDVCLILPLILLIKSTIPFLLCNLYLRAFTPDLNFRDPPSFCLIIANACSSCKPIVISQLLNPDLFIKRDPSPSIRPASHSFQDLSFEHLEDNGRVVSEVPTKKLNLFVTC
jgi:hypothetical protein